MKKNDIETLVPVPPQELNKYNRESGKKTLLFVGGLIAVIAILTLLALSQLL